MGHVSKVLAIALFVMLCAACGHGHDLDPYVIEREGESEWTGPIDGFDTEELTPSRHAKATVVGLSWDLLLGGAPAIEIMDFATMMPIAFPSVSTASMAVDDYDDGEWLRSKHVAIERTQTGGGTMRAEGDVLFVRNKYHCAIFSTMDVEFDSYSVHSRITINGSGVARLIFTSYMCKFFQNIHADIRLGGAFTADDQIVKELSVKIDFESSKGRDSDFKITSATVATDGDPLYCYDYNDETMCMAKDIREPASLCAAEEDICETTWKGHRNCLRPGLEEIGAHCNLGCCSELWPRVNTCNNRAIEGRECSPELEPLFTAEYLLWGKDLKTYEVPIRCSDDGIWTPPCSAELNTCPLGGQCDMSPGDDWGEGFEDYGICSCLLGE